LAGCVECAGLLTSGALQTECAVCFTVPELGGEVACAECFAGLAAAMIGCLECAGFTVPEILAYLRRTKKMPTCIDTHAGARVQGQGLCCKELAAGRLQKQPAGTTLPPYQPGDLAAGRIPVGRFSSGITAGGTRDGCGTCMIVGSASRKHPGKPVLKFVRGGPSCPSSVTGCCSMAA
jgi:hypothetical protein